jgi:response regulator RpfG family c-di-GMP phosphodiesterase
MQRSHVLLVEADADLRDVLFEALRDGGYRVTRRRNAKAALRTLLRDGHQHRPPDLCLVDVAEGCAVLDELASNEERYARTAIVTFVSGPDPDLYADVDVDLRLLHSLSKLERAVETAIGERPLYRGRTVRLPSGNLEGDRSLPAP